MPNTRSLGLLSSYYLQFFSSKAVTLAHDEKYAKICTILVWKEA